MKINKIVVTGSDGFVGKYLVALLKKSKKNQVFPLDRKQADITKAVEVKKYLAKIKPDQVYHLAGFASAAGKDKDLIFKVNVSGTINILESLIGIGKPCRVLLASTAYVYGNTPTCAKEGQKTSPNGFYDKSKVRMEQEALKIKNANLEIIITRAANHTGPGQKLGFVVPDFCSQIAKAKDGDEIMVGNLEAKRDLFDVRDCVKAYKIAMEKGESGEVYNVGSGRPVKIMKVLDEIISLSKKKIKKIADPNRMRPSDISKNCVSPRKLQKLGWQPRISLKKTLKDVYCSF